MTLLDADVAVTTQLATHRYNDDLLINGPSREMARHEFPRLFHVLDDEALRTAFASADRSANAAKRDSQRAGMTAMALALVSLQGAATEPLWRDAGEPWATDIAVAAAMVGLAAFVIAGFGVLWGPRKREWLFNRLYTERLRQFHFQSFIWNLPAIAASRTDQAAATAFVAARTQEVTAFADRLSARLDSELSDLLGPEAGDRLWLDEAARDVVPTLPAGFDPHELFRAYRRLRLEEQLNYASHKLTRPLGAGVLDLRGSLIAQQRMLNSAWVVSMLVLLTAHSWLVASYLLPWLIPHQPWLHVAVVSFALLALGAHALTEALRLDRDIERYEEYRARTSDALRRFEAHSDPAEKLRVMMEFERTSFDEMRSFLISAHSAHFVL